MSLGSRTDRLKSAARAGQTPQQVEAFLASFTRSKTVDGRKYQVRHINGQFFRKWESSGLDTVKRTAIWTNEQEEAAAMTMDDWDKNAYMDLITGFGPAARLERATA